MTINTYALPFPDHQYKGNWEHSALWDVNYKERYFNGRNYYVYRDLNTGKTFTLSRVRRSLRRTMA